MAGIGYSAISAMWSSLLPVFSGLLLTLLLANPLTALTPFPGPAGGRGSGGRSPEPVFMPSLS